VALILGIESSCDDLAAAVVRDGTEVLASVVHSQDDVHAPYGGVVPELASRDHVRHVHVTVRGALERAGITLDQIHGIGVTAGPGLIGSLLVGLSFAKALAYRTGKPLLAVHHIEGHLASARLDETPIQLPFVGLVVSGGHTALYRVETLARLELLGQTRDDAAGEAFDKVAKRLGLGYPGGRERLLDEDERASGGELPEGRVADLAASFQEAVVDVLVEKARRALRSTGLARLAVVGGLAANTRLRERMAELADREGSEVRFPPVRLCTDNAAMIGAVADRMLREGRTSGLELEAFSRVPPAGAAP
jgi:N6-L-threonylcarbamoyladenine synthase